MAKNNKINPAFKMNIAEIRKIVKKISFAPSCIDMGYKFQVKTCKNGFLLRTSFKRPDTKSGEVGIGYGRWMFIHEKADERSVVMTIWVCIELIVKHELMESFLFSGCRILDPHKSLEELSYPNKLLN